MTKNNLYEIFLVPLVIGFLYLIGYVYEIAFFSFVGIPLMFVEVQINTIIYVVIKIAMVIMIPIIFMHTYLVSDDAFKRLIGQLLLIVFLITTVIWGMFVFNMYYEFIIILIITFALSLIQLVKKLYNTYRLKQQGILLSSKYTYEQYKTYTMMFLILVFLMNACFGFAKTESKKTDYLVIKGHKEKVVLRKYGETLLVGIYEKSKKSFTNIELLKIDKKIELEEMRLGPFYKKWPFE